MFAILSRRKINGPELEDWTQQDQWKEKQPNSGNITFFNSKILIFTNS